MIRFSTIIAALALLTGCQDLNVDERRLAEPTIDFSSIYGAPTPSDNGAGSDGATSFEERLEQASSSDDAAPPDDTRSMRQVPVGPALVSEIPDDPDAWQWSRRGDLSLISMTPPGDDLPQVLILATNRPQGLTSLAGRTFLNDIDPALIDSFALFNDDSLTMGRGLGYYSSPGTFSGWRWLGRSDEDLLFRLAQTHGDWGPQPPIEEALDALLDGLMDQFGDDVTIELSGDLDALAGLDLDGALGDLQGLSMDGADDAQDLPDRQELEEELPPQPESPFANRPPQRAQMLFGEVQSNGTHTTIALLCAGHPQCPASAELTRFLERLQPGQASQSARQQDFDDHAASLGLLF